MVARCLTREEQNILNWAFCESMKLVHTESGDDLQDGMLSYYLEQSKAADVNVEARIAREPFDMKDLLHGHRK